jgi:hypothetical protein
MPAAPRRAAPLRQYQALDAAGAAGTPMSFVMLPSMPPVVAVVAAD